MKCLNCGTEYEGKFCPECGQSAKTGRFTMKFIMENMATAVLGRDGSIWFTIKSLFTRPGEMIMDNLNGKRKKYFSPFPMLFMVLALFILITTITNSSNIDKMQNSDYVTDQPVDASTDEVFSRESKHIVADFTKLYYSHYTLATLLTLPLAVVAARACYGRNNRKRYYWAEYAITVVYAMVIVFLFRCLVNLLYPISPLTMTRIDIAGTPLISIIAYTVCFRKMLGFSVAKTAWRSILTELLYNLMLLVLILFLAVILAVYLALKY